MAARRSCPQDGARTTSVEEATSSSGAWGTGRLATGGRRADREGFAATWNRRGPVEGRRQSDCPCPPRGGSRIRPSGVVAAGCVAERSPFAVAELVETAGGGRYPCSEPSRRREAVCGNHVRRPARPGRRATERQPRATGTVEPEHVGSVPQDHLTEDDHGARRAFGPPSGIPGRASDPTVGVDSCQGADMRSGGRRGHCGRARATGPRIATTPPRCCSGEQRHEGQVVREFGPAAREEQTSEGETPGALPA